MWPEIIGAVGGGLVSSLFGPDENQQMGLWGPQADALEQGYAGAGDVLKAGRQRLVGMGTPFGYMPWAPGVDAGMPEAAALGFGAYHQGGGAYDTLTDPGLMLDVANNPYVAGAADAVANDVQRRFAGSAAGKNYGGSAHLKAASGAIADAQNKVYNQAYSQGLQAMLGGSAQMPSYAQTPMELMNAYQMADYNYLLPYMQIAGTGPSYGTGQEAPDVLGGAAAGAEFAGGLFPNKGMPTVPQTVAGFPMGAAPGGWPW